MKFFFFGRLLFLASSLVRVRAQSASASTAMLEDYLVAIYWANQGPSVLL